jgi:hypothetical protein
MIEVHENVNTVEPRRPGNLNVSQVLAFVDPCQTNSTRALGSLCDKETSQILAG